MALLLSLIDELQELEPYDSRGASNAHDSGFWRKTPHLIGCVLPESSADLTLYLTDYEMSRGTGGVSVQS